MCVEERQSFAIIYGEVWQSFTKSLEKKYLCLHFQEQFYPED